MKIQDLINKKILIAEKRILDLTKSNDLRRLSEIEKYQISEFYKEKSKNRLETAKIIYDASKRSNKKGINDDYKDYAEVVAVAGVKELVSGTETVNGLEITVDETFYTSDTKTERSATLIVGKSVLRTIEDGDSFVEKEDESG